MSRDGKKPDLWMDLRRALEEIVRARETEARRSALCNLLDRLGGDGATAYINGETPEQVSDEIYAHVLREHAAPAQPTEEQIENLRAEIALQGDALLRWREMTGCDTPHEARKQLDALRAAGVQAPTEEQIAEWAEQARDAYMMAEANEWPGVVRCVLKLAGVLR